MIRSLAVAGVLAVSTGGAAAPVSGALPLAEPVAVTYTAPVPAPFRVVRPFDPPTSPYGPGHRGVDLGTKSGEAIRAAGEANVRFAASVAGRGVVVLAHPDGVTTEYEPVRPVVRAGDAVARGQPIATIDGTHGTCPPAGCLHWGAKRAREYFDPLTLLRRLGPVRLLPWSSADPPGASAMIGACELSGVGTARCRDRSTSPRHQERSPPSWRPASSRSPPWSTATAC